jgi:hypothetical protein
MTNRVCSVPGQSSFVEAGRGGFDADCSLETSRPLLFRLPRVLSAPCLVCLLSSLIMIARSDLDDGDGWGRHRRWRLAHPDIEPFPSYPSYRYTPLYRPSCLTLRTADGAHGIVTAVTSLSALFPTRVPRSCFRLCMGRKEGMTFAGLGVVEREQSEQDFDSVARLDLPLGSVGTCIFWTVI